MVDFMVKNAQMNWVLGEIENQYYLAVVNLGEIAGVLATKSIGEPATQMTLKTFHYVGVSVKNVTFGVLRLQEIINVAKTVKTPGLTIYLQKEFSGVQENAKKVLAMLEYTALGDIVKFTKIYYDPQVRETVVAKYVEFVKEYYELSDKTTNEIHKLSPWVLRIELN